MQVMASFNHQQLGQSHSSAIKIIQDKNNPLLFRRALRGIHKKVLDGSFDVLEKLVADGVLEALCQHLDDYSEEDILLEQLDVLGSILGRSSNQMVLWANRIKACGG